ncbi:hypothetical protein CWI36_1205p0010 [Hamiltosporidium magnivora]|uniref:Uncharacterized protein n=1 Tax=Hamiltosporidium magnivora TaxID=148818 RepID=A0A4Q9L5B5_9MICR|nr:hypothetical protein CWI36_1205p0010 [Hamiltosporidium magnivora]
MNKKRIKTCNIFIKRESIYSDLLHFEISKIGKGGMTSHYGKKYHKNPENLKLRILLKHMKSPVRISPESLNSIQEKIFDFYDCFRYHMKEYDFFNPTSSDDREIFLFFYKAYILKKPFDEFILEYLQEKDPEIPEKNLKVFINLIKNIFISTEINDYTSDSIEYNGILSEKYFKNNNSVKSMINYYENSYLSLNFWNDISLFKSQKFLEGCKIKISNLINEILKELKIPENLKQEILIIFHIFWELERGLHFFRDYGFYNFILYSLIYVYEKKCLNLDFNNLYIVVDNYLRRFLYKKKISISLKTLYYSLFKINVDFYLKKRINYLNRFGFYTENVHNIYKKHFHNIFSDKVNNLPFKIAISPKSLNKKSKEKNFYFSKRRIFFEKCE